MINQIGNNPRLLCESRRAQAGGSVNASQEKKRERGPKSPTGPGRGRGKRRKVGRMLDFRYRRDPLPRY